jgi:hypothetical protein
LARLLVVAIVAFLVFVALRGLLAKKNLSVRQFFSIYAATIFGLILLFLGATGRLHPLYAVFGAVFPFLLRTAPLIMRGAQLASMFRSLKTAIGGSVGPPPQTSEISSRYIHMVLFHDTGMMDGTILEGQFKDTKLSQLELVRLKELLREIGNDADSSNLLTAYLDREHEAWRSGEESTEPSSSSDNMSESQAIDILGLEDDATKENVIQAHRRMMQKVHPDRGGSTYLATKINAAKEMLIKIRG